MAKANSTRVRKARSVKSIPKPRRKPALPLVKTPASANLRDGHRARPDGKLPDLAPIFDDLHGARALVTTAHIALRQSNAYGPEEYVLSQGVEALVRVYNALDRADGRLSRLCRKQAKVRRTAP